MLMVAGLAASATVARGDEPSPPIGNLQGEMAGEATDQSVILQSRLTEVKLNKEGDAPGTAGTACFEIADNPRMKRPRHTPWLKATAEHDFIIKTKVDGLKPRTRYYYRLVIGPAGEQSPVGPIRQFSTLAGEQSAPVRFAVATGLNYGRFMQGPADDGRGGVTGDDRRLGFPAFATIRKLNPDFFISTGDSVYYDIPQKMRAKTPDAMRRKWREVFLQSRAKELFSTVPTYWEKDDHDTRYDDCDATGDRKPSLADGIRVFNEQTPVVDPAEPSPKTYRTHRVSKDLQIWLTEGRDYRSPNAMPDGPEKTIWGAEQMAWLKKSLLDSTATFKMLILPTPMVGPDGPVKRDSHVNLAGFRHERDAFFRWVKEQQLVERGLLIICGDRHWQYHSIDPSGIEEFSTGAFVTNNARLGVKPGEKHSSDPEGRIKQPFTSPKPSGGFLLVTVTPMRWESAPGPRPEAQYRMIISAEARFDFHDEQGNVLYTVTREAK